ncbi:L-threonylcarbamoyladenylate synthase [Alkalibacillus sp. S2W]|uniref:L-threonylcarbamoyladenylate synthase n=1 Tax=Alkalibacillus sp. S2W TaxID=3386553 RepID=UPI00398CA7DC
METKHWTSHDELNNQAIHEAAERLKQGETIAFPTETVYGLGADATNDHAVSQIFQAKGRPADNPLIAHVGSSDLIYDYVTDVSEDAEALINAFWPGPLTLILPAKSKLAENVTAGLTTVGFRMPDHPVALALLQAANIPVAAPSANRSGKPSPTAAGHVLHDLDGKIYGVLDGGMTGVGVESTVIDMTLDPPMILRPGGVTQTEIEAVIGPVNLAPSLQAEDDAPRSPGMKYKHYAPDCPIWIVNGGAERMKQVAHDLQQDGKRVGFMVSDERAIDLDQDHVYRLGSQKDLLAITRHLYDRLRQIDNSDYEIILAEAFPKDGIGEALMNRLEKAASETIE